MQLTEIGGSIRNCRMSRGYNQGELAELASLNRVTVAKYEEGKVEPGAKALIRLADALDVSLDILIGRKTGEKVATTLVLDKRIVDTMTTLSPQEIQRVLDFVAGMKVQKNHK